MCSTNNTIFNHHEQGWKTIMTLKKIKKSHFLIFLYKQVTQGDDQE